MGKYYCGNISSVASVAAVEMMRFWCQICIRSRTSCKGKYRSLLAAGVVCIHFSLSTTSAASEFWMNIFCLRAPPSGFLVFSFPLKCCIFVLLYSKLTLQKNLAMQNAICKFNHILLLPLLLIMFSFQIHLGYNRTTISLLAEEIF